MDSSIDNSAVVRTLRSSGSRLAVAARQSRTLGPLVPSSARTGETRQETTTDPSETTLRSGISRLQAALDSATLTRAVRSVGEVLALATTHSILGRVATGGGQYARGSWLYRWLTAEPDPDVVVIDLRETLTVGPWLAALEGVLRWLLPATAASVVCSTGARSWHVLVARPVQIGSLVLGVFSLLSLVITALAGTLSPAVSVLLVALCGLSVLGSRVTMSWAELTDTRAYQAVASAFEPPEPPQTAESAGRERQPRDESEKSTADEERTDR